MAHEIDNSSTNTKEPSILDLFTLMLTIKDDTEEMKASVNSYTATTNSKLDEVNHRIDNVTDHSAKNRQRIEKLEESIEILKQDQLRNNICISGVPAEKVMNANTKDIVIAIAKKLGIDLSPNNFTSYPVAKNKFIIVNMYNITHKQSLLNKIRVKKSLLVEEVFGTQSNSQIYLNDHLTPYFNRLFLIARTAKKEGKLASATSNGGKIRARKCIDDAPSIIYSERQLHEIIERNNNNQSISSNQLTSDCSDSNTSTPTVSKERTAHNKRPNKRKSHTSQKSIKSQDKQKRTEKSKEKVADAHKAKQQQSYDNNRSIPPNKTSTNTAVPQKKARFDTISSSPVHIK